MAGPFLTPGGFFQQYMWTTSRCCNIQNMKALGLVVSEKKKIFKSFPIYFNVKTFDPWGRAIFDPRGDSFNNISRGPLDVTICQILKLYALQFQRRRFWIVSYIFQCKNFWPLGQGHFWPQGDSFNNICRGPLDVAIYQIWKLSALQFRRRRFLKVSLYILM